MPKTHDIYFFFVGILCSGGFATLSSPQQGHQLTMGLYIPGTAYAMLGRLHGYDGPRQSLALACGDLCAEDLSACQVQHAKEKEEILRETWWLDVLGTGTFHLISVDEFNILFPSMSSTDLVTVWIDQTDGYPGKQYAARESLLAWRDIVW